MMLISFPLDELKLKSENPFRRHPRENPEMQNPNLHTQSHSFNFCRNQARSSSLSVQ